MRAPCLSEAMAQAYADPDCSSSSSLPLSLSTRQSPKLRRSRNGRHTKSNIISSLLLLLLALPIASALFDPGLSEPTKELPSDSAISNQGGLASSRGSSLSLISPKGQPISLHPDCRRTSDLFDNVCHNPWSPFSSSQRKQKGLTQSEIVICPLGETRQNGEKERVFAITGTITLPETIYEDVEASSSSIITATLGDKGGDWPKPGDEGFWRQRDGELEWVPTEVRALLETDVTPANIPKMDTSKGESASTPDVAQVKEYDEWSASIGGEDSKTWLSFEQWKADYLAAEREQEKQKHAAGKKQKADKAKEKKNGAQASLNNATEGATEPQQSLISSQETNLTTDSIVHLANGTAPSSPLSSEEGNQPLSENVEESQQSKETEISNFPEPTHPSVVKADTSQDTGSIPAVGDPSSQLSTLKHRWNFASLDCAAVVHRANPSAKFTSSILSEKKDRYMLSPCPESGGSDQQFVVVELCDEISVDTIVLANYEFFSRMFKRFRVRVSRNLNGGEGDWYDIGTFRARNVRGLQVFNTMPPTADSRFFRYVRIDFLEHYGSEYYCPISLLRVYGLTQMDDYIREEEEMRKQREVELTLEESESIDEEEDEDVYQKETALESVTSTNGVEQHTETAETPVSSAAASTSSPIHSTSLPTVEPIAPITTEEVAEATFTAVQDAKGTLSNFSSKKAEVEASNKAHDAAPTPLEGHESALSKPSIDIAKTYENNTANDNASMQMENLTVANSTALFNKVDVNASDIASGRVVNESGSEHMSAANSTASSLPIAAVNATNSAPRSAAQASTSDTIKLAGGNQPPHQGGSESIYRTITKRLNTLEMNATLSLQYMEHSRQQLREVFGRMERNQREKIAEMLQELNSSNWRQIESLKRRQQVDLQQAIFEFDKHRQQTDAERRALLAQVHILSNEVILEKRFGIAQLVLLLGLFVFMAMTRGSKAAPLIHQGLARISKTSPLNMDDSISSPVATIRGSNSPGNLARMNNLASSKPRSSSPDKTRQQSLRSQLPSTPRSGKQYRGSGRVVHLRGNSHIKSVTKKGRLNGFMSPSPFHVRNSISSSTTSDQHRRQSLQDQETALVINSPSVRPNIELITAELPDRAGIETPVQRYAPQARSFFNRESTPTNFMEAKQANVDGAVLPLPTSSATSTIDESFNSDWGTERSDDDNESHTSQDWDNEMKAIDAVNKTTFHSPILSVPQSPISNPVYRIHDSDAEEDSPKWNSVKSRRSLKRPGSSGSWQANGQSRVHTPTNHTTTSSPRRTFSPFHKNAEIEIN